MRIPRFCLPILLLLTCASGLSADQGATEKKIISNLKSRFPDLEITSIRESGLNGFYEIMLGAEIIYVSQDGRYLFQGNLLDLDQQRNLTEDRRSLARVEILKGISAADMIIFSPAKPKHSIYVFTDIDCPYCQRLHRDVPRLNEMGIAVKYLAFPRAGVGSDTYRDMEAVWCAKDRNKALTDAKQGVKIKSEKCDDPVGRQYLTGQDIGIRGTPAIYLEDGRQIGGYLSPEEIAEELEGS